MVGGLRSEGPRYCGGLTYLEGEGFAERGSRNRRELLAQRLLGTPSQTRLTVKSCTRFLYLFPISCIYLEFEKRVTRARLFNQQDGSNVANAVFIDVQDVNLAEV